MIAGVAASLVAGVATGMVAGPVFSVVYAVAPLWLCPQYLDHRVFFPKLHEHALAQLVSPAVAAAVKTIAVLVVLLPVRSECDPRERDQN